MRIKHIDICQTFLRDIVEENDIYIYIKYISSKEKPADIIMYNFYEADHVKYSKRITEGELWVIV